MINIIELNTGYISNSFCGFIYLCVPIISVMATNPVELDVRCL